MSSSDFSEDNSDYSTGYNVYKNGDTNNNNNLLSANDHQDNVLNIFTTPQRNHIGIDDIKGMSIQEDMIDLSISNNDDGIGGRSTFGRRSSFDSILQQQQSSLEQQQQQPFTSKLGRRIWEQYCTQSISQSPQRHVQNSQSSAIPSFQQLPTIDFLQLPSSIIQIYTEVIPSSNSNDDNKKNDNTKDESMEDSSKEERAIEWVNIEELERRVMQHHLDLEAVELTTSSSSASSLLLDDSPSSSQTTKPSSNRSATHEKFNNFNPNSGIRSSISSSLITSECFTKVINRHTNIGLGMSLRIYNGCVYIHSLLRLDGSRIEYSSRNESCDRISFVQHDDNNGGGGGPAANVGLLPGDRLLGLNGLPFLKGQLATTTTTDINNNDKTTLKITGSAKIKQQTKQPSDEEILKSVGELISTSKSPMAVHIQRVEDDREWILDLLNKAHRESFRKKKKSNGTIGLQNPKRMSSSNTTKPKKRGPKIHPFAKALSKRSIIKSTQQQELLISRQLQIFTDRTRQWESKLSFKLSSSVNNSSYTLKPMLDVRDVEPTYYASFIMDDKECPTYFDYKGSKSIRNYAPSTPMIQDWRRRMEHDENDNGGGGMISSSSPPRRVSQRISKEVAIMIDLYDGLDDDDRYVQDLILDNDQGSSSYSSKLLKAMSTTDPSDVYVPLVGVRKALCIRILNTFLDSKNRTAFTIWCYDVESGMEWYAPVRYYTDFKDLRSALIRVDKSIGDIPFPTIGSSWLSFSSSSEAKESPKVKETRRNQLEIFLRRVFASVYRGRLHPYIAEIAVHLQTFVGCDTVLNDDDGVGNDDVSKLSLSNQVAISEVTYGKRDRSSKLNSEPEDNARLHLKRSIMRYVYRLFLLPSVGELVGHFIDAARDKVMSNSMVLTTRQSHQFSVDKKEATDNVGKIRDFIDQVQELILEGCIDDFISISQRRDFAAFVDDPDNIARDELFREAVREQTELEIYVPLRSTISKYLVYAWFNEDMELKHKTKVCIYSFVSCLPMLDVCASILTKHLLLNLCSGFEE